MAENLVILGAIASVVGVFFLVLFSVLARRQRRALWKIQRAHLSTRGIRAPQVSWRVAYAVLVLVAILAVISFLLWRNPR
jgi:drug/metabolite transporter (DMT)-like permease